MVTRKPVPHSSDSSNLEPISIPSYPENPTSSQDTSSFRVQDVRGQMATSATDSEPTSANAWVEEGLNRHRTEQSQNVPDALRPGPPGYTPRTSQEKLRQETNPFLKKQNTGSSQDGNRDSSASVWNEKPSEPSAPPPPGKFSTRKKSFDTHNYSQFPRHSSRTSRSANQARIHGSQPLTSKKVQLHPYHNYNESLQGMKFGQKRQRIEMKSYLRQKHHIHQS